MIRSATTISRHTSIVRVFSMQAAGCAGGRAFFSTKVDEKTARASRSAKVRPAGPAPITTTRGVDLSMRISPDGSQCGAEPYGKVAAVRNEVIDQRHDRRVGRSGGPSSRPLLFTIRRSSRYSKPVYD